MSANTLLAFNHRHKKKERKKTCPPSALHVSVAKTSLKVTARVQVRQAED